MITINGSSIKQPSSLNELDTVIKSDKTAIDGSRQRDKFGEKKESTMEWEWLRPGDYRDLVALFKSGDAVDYKNDNSAKRSDGLFEFTGLPEFQEDEYFRGSSLIKGLRVTIREV